MPTLIAIDSSFSMSQSAFNGDKSTSLSKLKLADICCREIIDGLSEKHKLEHIAIVTFSSDVNVLCDFTRDTALLKSSLAKVALGDKSVFSNFVSFSNKLICKEWGCMQPCNVVVITDGRFDMDQEDHILQIKKKSDSKIPVDLYDFECQLYFLCLESEETLNTSGVYRSLKLTMDKNKSGTGSIFPLLKPQNSLKLQSDVVNVLSKFIDESFEPFKALLQCGDLRSEVILYPATNTSTFTREREDEVTFDVVGFLNISDLGNAPVMSRHIMLAAEEASSSKSGDENGSSSKTQPCFTVLLHGSLKTENKVALVRTSSKSFGIISSWTDNKTKSNLVLSLFTPGFTSIPWLGDFRYLGPASLLPTIPSSKKGVPELPTFPTQNRKGAKRSYAQPTVAWTRPTGLQTDVQKILRSVKKLPEKSQVFYKDLNRLRRAALSFGFHDLLEGISQLLERECTLLPGTAHPEATLQLSHAARELKASINMGYDYNLEPLKTDFKFHGR